MPVRCSASTRKRGHPVWDPTDGLPYISQSTGESEMISRSLISITIFFALSTLCFAENDHPFSIRVESPEREKILLDFPVEPGDRFYLHYIHSSDKTPIRDTFEVGEDGQLFLIEEAFLWHGAGLEFMNWEKASIMIEDGMIKVHLRRHFPSLLLRVGRIADHTFTFHGVSLRLKGIAKGGELLKIWVAPKDPS